MASLQWNLEQLFCPPIDSTLIAAIVNDNPDFDTCFDILSSLAEEANSVLDAEGDIENELSSVDSSSNFRIHSYGEPGDGSITSIDSRSVEDDYDYLSTDYEYESYDHSKGKTKFLKNMFPKLSDDRVNTLLRENDNNVEKAVDVILNETYLENEQLEDDFSCSDSTSTIISNSNTDNFLRTNARFEHRKTKRRRKPQRKDMIIFQNTGHRSNSNNSSSSSSSSSSTNSSCWTSSRKPWNKSERESRDGLIDDNKLCQLLDLFPDHNFERLKQTLIDCCGEVQDAIDTLSSEGTLNSSKRQQSKATKQTYHTSEHQNIYLHNSGRHGSIQNCKIYDDDEIVDYEDSYDPDHCQREAFRCYNKRDEMFKKAAQSYQRGQRGVASYQSDEGWKFDAEMKIWKLRAARSLVKKHSEKSKSEYILDLHGCFVTEAIIIVKEWLNDWYPRSDSLKPLKIITGKGNHSPHGVAKLPNAINKFLVNDNWDITKYTGYVLVHGLKNNPRKIY